jgi:mannosyl-oligosaccharide glucosidase
MELSDAREARPTLLFVQITAELPATVDLVFTPHSVDRGGGGGKGDADTADADDEKEETLEQRVARLSGPALTSLIAERESQFDARFDRAFRVPDEDVPPVVKKVVVAAAEAEEEGKENDDGAAAARPQQQTKTVVVSKGVSASEVKEAAKAALSNLLGTMGYFHGRSRVLVRGQPLAGAPPHAPGGPEPGAAPNTVVGEGFPSSLFTAVPSRSTFPRGFLWDEGFHQLLVRRWDAALCRDALASWLDLLTASGWVPREQILGAEARARVPNEFVVQRPGHGNPPSLLLPILEMAEDVQGRAARWVGGGGGEGGGDDNDKEAELLELARGAEFLARAWPRLEAWYGWFNRTQAGSAPGTYRWHGRAPVPAPLTLAASDASSPPSSSSQAAQWAAAASLAPDEAAREEAEAAASRLAPPPLAPRLKSSRAELNPKTLTSGLDDYPRASHPSPDERHLDLRCWMALASRAMATVARAAREGVEAVEAARAAKNAAAARALSSCRLPAPPGEAAERRYASAARALSDLDALKRLHLDEASGEFRDYGLHTEDVRLGRARVAVVVGGGGPGASGGGRGSSPAPPPPPAVEEEVREVREEYGAPPRPGLVPAYGYVSLFPLLTGLLPPGSPELSRQLALLRGGGGEGEDEGEEGDEAAAARALWTPHGLRSLSPSSRMYRARNTADDPPYWRGQVWINVNYLALRALRRYAAAADGGAGGEGEGAAAAAAGEAARGLRAALLRTVAGGYARTGFFWEQYDDRTGEGMGSRPFTGWTALVTLIAAEE